MPGIKTPWTIQDIPNLNGKTALVTGATGGLGFECALHLASKGAKVFLGGRNPEKAAQAISSIKSIHPNADVSFALIDQCSLSSISNFCEDFNPKNQRLDILINNAGIMATPTRESTSDSFELQLGTNYLGHFALTAQLLPSLCRSSLGEPSRVVNVSSLVARNGKIHFNDLNWEHSYSPWAAYYQSKLANLLFSFELQKQSDSHGWGIMALSAHPGIATTELISNGPGDSTWTGWAINTLILPFFSHSQLKGTLPILYAATSPDAQRWSYYGVNGFREFKGDVCEAYVPPLAKDEETAKRLWEESEKLIRVKWG